MFVEQGIVSPFCKVYQGLSVSSRACFDLTSSMYSDVIRSLALAFVVISALAFVTLQIPSVEYLKERSNKIEKKTEKYKEERNWYWLIARISLLPTARLALSPFNR